VLSSKKRGLKDGKKYARIENVSGSLLNHRRPLFFSGVKGFDLMNIFKTPLKLEVAQQCQLTLKVTSQRF
jgi:hypothetical protein